MTQQQFQLSMAECARLRAVRLSEMKDYNGAQREYNEQAAWLRLVKKDETL
jgi:hypothetical protein